MYFKFLDAVKDFRSLDALPTKQKFEGENLAELFYQNKAKWHKSCYLKFSTTQLMRVKKQLEKKRECNSSDYEERVSKCRCVNSDAEDSNDCNDDLKLAGSSSEKTQRRSKHL